MRRARTRRCAIPDIQGHVQGVTQTDLGTAQRLYQQRVSNDQILSDELAKAMCQLSRHIGRPVGVLLTRRGMVQEVIIGTDVTLSPSTLNEYRRGTRSLRGLRLIRTQIADQPLTKEAVTDLAFLRLDLLGVLSITPEGGPGTLHLAHILPLNAAGEVVKLLEPCPFHPHAVRFDEFIRQLEKDLHTSWAGHAIRDGQESAVLVSASSQSRWEQEDRLAELADLAASAGVKVLDRVTQRIAEGHQRYVMGSGKLKEVLITTLHQGADMVIFDQTLSPAQSRAISELTDTKVIDRTQLILDIFARRAHTREGKLQVELAQLRYLLPRLSGRGTHLSRLGGGVGTRGPGETKLEMDRRRVRDRITRVERELTQVARQQDQRRALRDRHGLPVISLVGYTNAGKSTLLNVLTKSEVPAANRLFETLDTTSRRLRFPHGREVILTDTVGFIRDLPPELLRAFRTTLEGLREADLLVHVVDASAPNMEIQMTSVTDILAELELDGIPRLLVLNKCDRLGHDECERLYCRHRGIGISALQAGTLGHLLLEMEARVRPMPVNVPSSIQPAA